jgi:phage shock protein A
MGVFSRFRDIISSNINAMLDRAEDPEKLISLMIREMEDTLVEMKASCAGVIASSKKIERQIEEVKMAMKVWEDRADLAVSKGRDDLAKEALMEKRRYAERSEALDRERGEHHGLIEQYQQDIGQLEDKLKSAGDKQRSLAQRHMHAMKKRRAQEEIRRMETSESLLKFDELEKRIDRMEAEADLVNSLRKPTLEAQFENLIVDEEIEKELQILKSNSKKQEGGEMVS